MMDHPRFALAFALVGGSAEMGAGVRERVSWAGRAGFSGVVLDGTAAGVRARELDRSARRDVAAMMRRAGVVCAGVDLFIPAAHYVDRAHADRAIAAMGGAIGLAADLADLTGGEGVVFGEMARGEEAGGALAAIESSAMERGVRVADCAWPPDEGRGGESPIGVGIDPAAVLLGGDDPAAAVSRMKDRLAGVRLSDLSSSGRVAPGLGRLDELAYAVSIAVSGGGRSLVVDLRGVRGRASVAGEVVSRLGEAGPGESA